MVSIIRIAAMVVLLVIAWNNIHWSAAICLTGFAVYCELSLLSFSVMERFIVRLVNVVAMQDKLLTKIVEKEKINEEQAG